MRAGTSELREMTSWRGVESGGFKQSHPRFSGTGRPGKWLWVVGYTELGDGKLKNWNRSPEPNFEALPKLSERGVRTDEYDGLVCCLWLVAALSGHMKISRPAILFALVPKGEIPPG